MAHYCRFIHGVGSGW